MTRFLYVLNGPNLNLLGVREPKTYGADTLADAEALCLEAGGAHDLSIRFLQTNSESQLIDWIHEARGDASAIVINPAAYSHTSVAIRDALAAFDAPVVEVHVSNIHKREAFRHHSYVSGVADAMICGCGIQGYAFGVHCAATLIKAARAHA